MDEISPLLSNQPWEGSDLPSPNLRPRHQELIPTPCGPIKPWSELSCLVKLYFCFTIASLLALLALTLTNIYRQSMATYSYEDDFTVSLIQLVGILFCIYYITRGILQENRQELIVFVLSVLVVIMRSVVNFMVLPVQDRKDLLLGRFVCILCVGVVHVLCATLLIQRPNMMAFRVGGALESLQEQYFLINLCFSMVTFDLQAQVCLCILIMTSGTTMSFMNSIILGFGVVWACLTAATGAIAVSFKRNQAAGLGLCPSECAGGGLLRVPDVQDQCTLGAGQDVYIGGRCCDWSGDLSADQRRAFLGSLPIGTQLRPGPEGEDVFIGQAVRCRHEKEVAKVTQDGSATISQFCNYSLVLTNV